MERPIEPTTGDAPPPHAPDDDEQRRGADRTDECEELENERYAG